MNALLLAKAANLSPAEDDGVRAAAARQAEELLKVAGDSKWWTDAKAKVRRVCEECVDSAVEALPASQRPDGAEHRLGARESQTAVETQLSALAEDRSLSDVWKSMPKGVSEGGGAGIIPAMQAAIEEACVAALARSRL